MAPTAYSSVLSVIWAERKEGWMNWAHDAFSRVYLWHRDYCYIPPQPDRRVCVCVCTRVRTCLCGEGLRAHEFRMRQAHFAFHFTVLTTSRSSFSGNYIDYFSISGINEPRSSSSPLCSPLHPGDITLLMYTHRTPPPPRFFVLFFFVSACHMATIPWLTPLAPGVHPHSVAASGGR